MISTSLLVQILTSVHGAIYPKKRWLGFLPSVAATLHDWMARRLLGADALAIESHWRFLYERCASFGGFGAEMRAMSAIDLALWDIAGKAHGLPVWRLLGGRFRERVQPYATGFYRIGGKGEADRLAAEALRHHEAGFTMMKVKLGFGVEDDLACMDAIGKAIQGKPIRLMIDTNHAYGRAEALRLGRALEEHDLLWYEEPVVPEDIGGYVEMRQHLLAEALRKANPYLAIDNIAAGTYKDVPAVQTMAVGAQWVTSAKADTETVYQITKALYSKAAQDALAAGHAKGKFITRDNAVQGVGIPFHPGAEKFYKEVGLLK